MAAFEVGENGYWWGLVARQRAGVEETSTLIHGVVRDVFAELGPYRINLAQTECAVYTPMMWRGLLAAQSATRADATLQSAWGRGEFADAIAIGRRALARIRQETADQPLGTATLSLTNDLGFVELCAGHLVEARDLFQQCAVNGGLSERQEPGRRAVLACNLAAAHAGLGEYVEAREWASSALEFVADDPDARASALVVFLPDSEWAKHPRTVEDPIIIAVARGTMIGALAAQGDLEALHEATQLAETERETWVLELLVAVALKLGATAVADSARARLVEG